MTMSKRKVQLKGALGSLAKKREIDLRTKLINEITNHLNKISIKELQIIHNKVFNNSNINTLTYNKIIHTLNVMPETDLKSTSHLLRTMKYSHGKNKNQIISSYIQKKASNYVSDSLYKPEKSIHALSHNNSNRKFKNYKSKNHVIYKIRKLNSSVAQFKRKHCQHISRIRVMARHPPELKDDDIKT
ncbi:9541_t:CDS:1, partial [Ambispora gerdemannii]